MASDDYGNEKTESEVERNDDGSVTVKLVPPPEDLPEEAINLVPHYITSKEGQEFLKGLAKKVVEDVTEDWDSMEPYRQRRAERAKLRTGSLDKKSFPFEDCANAHIPVMLERELRLVHRLYAEMFPDQDMVFTAIPSSRMSQERADTVTLHQNWQIRKEIPDFLRQNRRCLHEYIANGDCVMHSYRDIAGKRNRHEHLNCEEFGWPYTWKTTAVDFSDVPRKWRIVRKFKHELKRLEADGLYADIERIFDKNKVASFDDGLEQKVRPVMDKLEGREKPAASKAAPYVFFEYHGWCKLYGQEEERPVVVTVEPKTMTVVALTLREEPDWKDRARFEREMKEWESFNQATQMFQQVQAQEQAVRDRLAQPDVPPEEAAELEGTLGQQAMMPPEPPSWMKVPGEQPKPVRMVPIEPFSHGVCIENPDGSAGLGIGLLLEEFNKAANTWASQFSDAATLANVVTIIKPESVKMETGELQLSPGKIHNVRGVSSEQLDKAFKVVQFPPANPQLLDMVRLALESADGVSSAPDVLSGEPGKANETFRGIATRVEQATKQLTVLAQNYLEFLGQVMRNNARLNAVFLEDYEILDVIDPRTMETQPITVGREMYAEDFEIAFTADTRFASKAQRISEADQLLGMMQALPPPIAMQMFPPSFIYEAIVKSLKARGFHDMVRFLGPRPPPPQQMPGMGMQPGMPPSMSPSMSPPGPGGGPPPPEGPGVPGPAPQPAPEQVPPS